MPTQVPPGMTGGAKLGPQGLRFGRRSPTPADAKRVWLSHYYKARGRHAINPPPSSSAYYNSISQWGMMLNNVKGDCVVASAGHLVMLMSKVGAGNLVTPPDSEIDAAYQRWCGPGDNGCMLPEVLNGWAKDGLSGNRVKAFAGVHGKDPVDMRVGVNEFGGVFAACSLPQSAIDEFDQGQPWTNTSEDGNPSYGHGFPLVGYDSSWVYIVTWGKIQKASWAWIFKYVGSGDGEAWVVIDDAWMSRPVTPAGVDVSALLADYQELTGQQPPAPPTPPAPPKPPTPPAPPTPVIPTSIRELVDQVFASLKTHFAGHALILMVLNQMQAWIDGHLPAALAPHLRSGFSTVQSVIPDLRSLFEQAVNHFEDQYQGQEAEFAALREAAKNALQKK